MVCVWVRFGSSVVVGVLVLCGVVSVLVSGV